jgi:Beta-propeller repeat/FG-GAP-like repeat
VTNLKSTRTKLGRGFVELECRRTPALNFGYAVQLGGAGDDVGLAVATDAAGNVYYTGGFAGTADVGPAPTAVQLTSTGSDDVFVAKYNPAGGLIWAVGFGGTASDTATCIAVDDLQNVYVGGQTASNDLATAGTAQSSTGGGALDGFVAKLDAAGNLAYATYLGGSATDFVVDIAVDATGAAYVTGQTGSTDFPTAAPFQAANAGGATDVFVAKLNPTGSALVYSTYLGHNGNDTGDGIAVDPNGNVVIAGSTRSPNFPLAGAPYQGTMRGSADGYVTKFKADGSGLIFSTFLGGGDLAGEGFSDVALDSAGNVYVTGGGGSPDYPLVNPIPGGTQGATYVSELDATGSTLLFSTRVDANGGGYAIAVDSTGEVTVCGTTSAGVLPVTDGSSPHGGNDAFVIRMHPAPIQSTVSYASYVGGSGNDYAQGVAVIDTHQIYVAGVFSGVADFDTGPGTANLTSVGQDAFLLQLSDNTAPSADAGGPYTVAEAGSIPLDGSASSDVDQPANSLNFTWDLDADGIFGETGAAALHGDETGATPIFSAAGLDGPGSISVTVRVTDLGGLTDEATVAVNITNVGPTATFLNTGPQAERHPATVFMLNPIDGSPADVVAGFHYSFDFNNDGDFTDLGDVRDSTNPLATFTFAKEGNYTVRGRIADQNGDFSDSNTSIAIWNTDIAVIGADRGGPPLVRVLDSRTLAPKQTFLAFDYAYRGGVRVASGDVNGDGTPDVIAATGGGAPALIRVFDATTGSLLKQFTPYAAPFKGGLFVAAGDVDGDGFAEIIVSADAGKSQVVRVVDGKKLTQMGVAQDQFTLAPFDAKFKGGVRVAVGDLDGDQRADIITATGAGTLATVKTYDGDTGNPISNWNPFAKLKSGVFVSAGDLDGDGKAEVVVSQGAGTLVRSFNPLTTQQLAELTPFADAKKAKGLRIAMADVDGDGKMNLVAAPVKGYGRLRIFANDFVNLHAELDTFDPSYKGGVFLG